MIEIDNVSFWHNEATKASLKDVTLQIPDGQCVLLCGESGSGKTTITRLINGLIPHYYEGNLKGSVCVNGEKVSNQELYKTARQVGSVFQNPRSQFFCVDTTSEIAFGCENMGMPEAEIENRVDEAVTKLGIQNLMGRSIFELSGGEKQKIACASVSALRPNVIVLDEPTSNLDIYAIEELKQTLLHWKKEGKTIVIAEHRLYWLTEICDRVIGMEKGKILFDLSMHEFKTYTDENLHRMGLRSIREEMIAEKVKVTTKKDECMEEMGIAQTEKMCLENFSFSYKDQKQEVLKLDEISIPKGEIVAVTGHNGAGKSTFSRCLCGLEKRFKGKVVLGTDTLGKKQLLKKSYMVMQDVNHQLFCETVEEEVKLGMQTKDEKLVMQVLEQLDLEELKERHPMSLSGGQKQRVAIAAAILAGKEILVFDEPTSGLDYRHMKQTAELLSGLKGKQTIFIVTHDVELMNQCCGRVLQLKKGRLL